MTFDAVYIFGCWKRIGRRTLPSKLMMEGIEQKKKKKKKIFIEDAK